jgi:hypothetical protein
LINDHKNVIQVREKCKKLLESQKKKKFDGRPYKSISIGEMKSVHEQIRVHNVNEDGDETIHILVIINMRDKYILADKYLLIFHVEVKFVETINWNMLVLKVSF